MNKKNKLLAILATTMSLSLPLQATIIETSLDVLNGFRQDKLSTEICSYSFHDDLLLHDRMNMHDLSFYQLGVKGLLDLCGWYARGEAYWGWTDNGYYSQMSKVLKFGSLRSRADVKKGRTRDFILGGGYLFSLGGILEVGPVGGWSYQYQQVFIKNVKLGGYRIPYLDRLQYSNHWEGPWVGVDAKFHFCGFTTRVGYEYHSASWRSKWLLHDEHKLQGIARSDKRKSSHAHGNVVYLDALWTFCPLVEVGASFKWQKWQATKGSKKFLVPHYRDEKDKVKYSKWDSFAVSFNLGLHF